MGSKDSRTKTDVSSLARGAALEFATIDDILYPSEAIDSELNRTRGNNLRRIVSMLTQWIQRSETVAENSNEYNCEYRDAE
jgi:hypothetical protein